MEARGISHHATPFAAEMVGASTPVVPGDAIVSASQSVIGTAMTLELKMLALSIVLGLVQIVLASHAASLQRGYVWTASSRDEAVPALTGVAGRLARALQNFVETFPLFAAAVLIAHVAATHSWMTEWGVQLYFWGRVIYLALYAAGVFLLRSLVWNIATLGIVLVLLSLV
jgi:uncharacterized MAPEG superfamily protein